ncbi:hypothetical protein HanRHA438_Chr08g0339281 [Helianthus annuus]|nr:hypothetical protein HanRHA438_Chr08g0339281 [Helianthus annuus]
MHLISVIYRYYAVSTKPKLSKFHINLKAFISINLVTNLPRLLSNEGESISMRLEICIWF